MYFRTERKNDCNYRNLIIIHIVIFLAPTIYFFGRTINIIIVTNVIAVMIIIKMELLNHNYFTMQL